MYVCMYIYIYLYNIKYVLYILFTYIISRKNNICYFS